MNAASSYSPRTMSVSCSQTTNGSSANTSTISWTLSTQGSSSSASLFDTGPTSLDIAGVNRYWKERVSWSANVFPAKVGSVSGSFTLSHKDDGSIDPITVSLSTAIYWGEVKTATGTWTLDKIDRYFSSTPSIAFSSKTETSISYTWSTSETCKKVVVHYKKSSESSYTNTTAYDNSSGATSGSFTLSGLAANTTYNVYITATRKDSSMPSDSSVNNTATWNYPYITKVETTALTIGNKQVITLSNPMSRSVTVKMYKTSTSGTVLYTSSATTGTSVTIDTSVAATKNALYASIPNDTSSYCVYSAICSSPSYTWTTSSNTYSYQIKGDEKPTFDISKLLTYDATTSVTNITGQTANGGWLVQTLSQLKTVVSAAGTAQNSATISKYEVTFAGATRTQTVSTTAGETWPTINGTGAQSVSIKVTDSRGLNNTYSKNVTYKPYQAPSISLSGGRVNNYGENIALTASFTSSSVESKNGIKVSWSGAGKSGYAVDNNGAEIGSNSTFVTAYSGSGAISTTASNDESYSFTATITDRFNKTATATLPVSIGTPIMFIDEEQLGVGINAFPSGEGLYVKGMTNVQGSAYIRDSLAARQFKDFYSLGVVNPAKWIYLGEYTLPGQGGYITLQCYYGNGQNGSAAQQVIFDINAMEGYYDGSNATTNIGLAVKFHQNYLKTIQVQQYQTSTHTAKLYMYCPGSYSSMVYCVGGNYTSYTAAHTHLSSAPTVHKSATYYHDFLDAYPVGSVFISTDQSSNPANTYGGTWAQISGYFLYCTSSSAGTGGSNTNNQTHTHSKSVSATSTSSSSTSIASNGAHQHNFSWGWSGDHSGWQSTVTSVGWASTWNASGGGIVSNGAHAHTATTTTTTTTSVSLTISNQGASSNGNMPAYYTVYAWRRTA